MDTKIYCCILYFQLDGNTNHVMLVVSPLLSLIVDQQAYLHTIGIKCCCLSDISAQTDTGDYLACSGVILNTLPPPLGNST